MRLFWSCVTSLPVELSRSEEEAETVTTPFGIYASGTKTQDEPIIAAAARTAAIFL